MNKKTIYALSTPKGKSAIAIVRISGKSAYKNIKKISSNMPKKENTVSLNSIVDEEGNLIDRTLTTFFKSPKSFTGEDMVEICIHGGGATTKKIIKTLGNFKNMQMAKPGEFTRRAFENNKLDLTQVEAISDLVNAETEIQRKQALSHLTGNFFKSSKKIFDNLKNILANIEAIIDFSEEELPKNLLKSIKEQIENNIKKITEILENSNFGISIREGFLITIIGKVNTGKSSFINAISDRDIAIVTNKPGTTRDLLESFVDIDGYPFRFIDTAGIRKPKDLVEKIGVNKALNLSKEASVNLVFIKENKDLNSFKHIKNAIFIKSKQDICGGKFKDRGYYNISSKTRFGIKSLYKLIKNKIHNKKIPENYYISRERHIHCLKSVKNQLLLSKNEKTIDLFAEDIRIALNKFQELFGNVDIEDILDIIFSDFCIGK